MPSWITSPQWDEARRTGFLPTARAEVWLDGTLQHECAVTGGTVGVDESSKVRRSLKLSVADIAMDPRDASDLLAPFGTELHMFAGMEYSGTPEEVPVGVFTLEESGRSSWTADLELSGFDRAGVLAEARFLTPWNTIPGTLVVDEIAALILSVLPGVEVFDLTGSEAAVRAASWDRDRWEAIDNLARGIGAEVFFDQAGRAIIRDVPTVGEALENEEDMVVIHANRDDSDLLDVATGMSRAGVYNAVVASSDQEVPIVAVAYQASGPLRWRPGFQKPRFYSTPVVQSYDGMALAATKILARSVAYSRKIAPQIIADYSLDVGTPVRVSLPDEYTETRILSQFSFDLGGASMACGTRLDPEVATTDDPGTLD